MKRRERKYVKKNYKDLNKNSNNMCRLFGDLVYIYMPCIYTLIFSVLDKMYCSNNLIYMDVQETMYFVRHFDYFIHKHGLIQAKALV